MQKIYSGLDRLWGNPTRPSLVTVLCVCLISTLSAPLQAAPLKLERPEKGTALVKDPKAPGGKCLAVRIQEKPGGVAMPFRWDDAAPGIYRVRLPLRLHTRPGFNSALLKLRVSFGADDKAWLDFPVAPAQLDGTAGEWSVLARVVTLTSPSKENGLGISWSFALYLAERKGVAAFEVETPDISTVSPLAELDGGVAESADDLDEFKSDSLRPLSEINYPAMLVGDPVIEPVATTLAIEKVWPEKVHVYPGEANPIEVTVRNFTEKETEATVRLEMKTGLDEVAIIGEEQIRIPARDSAKVKFPWKSGAREYGHEAFATLLVDGKPVHSASEYFTVSTPIWKTALQGSGFITWHGREHQFPSHVENNRRAYINVEEAFSWQPSSWTDLNPTTEAWFTGQNSFHNSLSGLKEWVERSHRHGIKMITYSWPTVSGKAGFDWCRRFPDIMCRENGGVAPIIDLEDLALQSYTHTRPELWRYQSGQWLSNFINLGLLRAIDHHAREVIKSSKNFGWDGLRFDFPPGWSPMGTEDVHKEFEMMGVQDLMKELLPEYYDGKEPSWSDKAISIRNLRYFRHIFKTEINENFALSYNAGGLTEGDPDKAWWLQEMCKGGGQIMNEAIRTLGSIPTYMDVAWRHAESARQAGGYSCLFMAERSNAPLAPAYAAVFTFASGSHPYLDYGWHGPMPGEYTKLMTRYGEYCWDLALAPVAADQAGVTVESKAPLIWERYLRQRQAGNSLQTVVHLIAPPEESVEKAALKSQVEWTRNVTITKKCNAEPTVWLLTAEPELTALRLQPERKENSYTVTVPTVRLWTVLVWSEKP
ncbi:MAG: hypothetical protein O3B01_29120 [Planctomycetota bacterium]|nr:hypothetical protein [Planctomycetota bacterium]